MATQNSALVRDNSTNANFRAWGSIISAFFTTAGWVASSDTGQVSNWTTQTAPAAGSYVYEIWKPNDGLTTFYLKVEYGTNTASTNTGPQMRLSIGTSTNGAGVLTGFVTGLATTPNSVVTVSSTVTQWQCYFSGDSGRIGVMMWRDDTANAGPLFFGVQRSLNSSGTPTSSYVTLVAIGNNGNSSQCFQQSVVFGVGVSTLVTPTSNDGGFICLLPHGNLNTAATALFNGQAAISPVFPLVGYYDNPMDIVAVGCYNDFTEGTQYSIASGNMPYGVSHNYIAGKNAPFLKAGTNGASLASECCLLMRYD